VLPPCLLAAPFPSISLKACGSKKFLKAALAIVGRGIELGITNSLWCDEPARILPAILTLAREKYAAELISLPFQSPET
jgi:hypothetical protein